MEAQTHNGLSARSDVDRLLFTVIVRVFSFIGDWWRMLTVFLQQIQRHPVTSLVSPVMSKHTWRPGGYPGSRRECVVNADPSVEGKRRAVRTVIAELQLQRERETESFTNDVITTWHAVRWACTAHLPSNICTTDPGAAADACDIESLSESSWVGVHWTGRRSTSPPGLAMQRRFRKRFPRTAEVWSPARQQTAVAGRHHRRWVFYGGGRQSEANCWLHSFRTTDGPI